MLSNGMGASPVLGSFSSFLYAIRLITAIYRVFPHFRWSNRPGSEEVVLPTASGDTAEPVSAIPRRIAPMMRRGICGRRSR